MKQVYMRTVGPEEMSRYTCPLCSTYHLRLADMVPTIESIYREIDELVDCYNCREAYKKLEVLGESIVDKAEWHRKCAEVCYAISNMEDKDQERIEWLRKGRKHALDAHELNPTSIAILKILCSTTGRLAEESGIRDKINLGFEFKTHLDRAVAVDPSCFELLHMRGRFSYQAEQLRPGVTENRLYLGRVLYAKGDYTEAKKWLVEAAKATCDEDESVEREHIRAAREMLQLKVFQK
ncbi:hypothetical protein TELCIR_00233 [Teladorsagia circumcincta]|uniref:Tetratricopeptide repeat protein n=1 Tax=Teladorsagia circumcincta TaxID=45464 RepID=A0A2G9V5C8_TELCI|nr:hypothetical protein TELCIR_00233 [Teladorsagia circumcincta]